LFFKIVEAAAGIIKRRSRLKKIRLSRRRKKLPARTAAAVTAATTAASAATIAAATTAASAAVAAATASASTAFFTRAGFIDVQRTTVNFFTVKLLNRSLRFFSRSHFNETETARKTAVAIGYDRSRFDRSGLRKKLMQIVACGFK
jgi:hypothetical protein